jgi:NAD(P)-dependent dehydrogenase (short-subunit alcohol dehydrogenase family)
MATILITGAARGIGNALVQRAIARGDTVFAAVRKDSDRNRFPQKADLHIILMDVANTKSVEDGFSEVDRLLAGRPLDAIINSAAISRPGAIEVSPLTDFEQALNTNTLGSLRILKAGVPRLRGHGGRLILLTSLWGKASGALLGSYCASKHAIESLADVVRRETQGMDLHIILVEPGVVKTEMLTTQAAECDTLIATLSAEQESLYGSLYRRYARLTTNTENLAISPEQCAMGIEKALFARKPRTRYRIGRDATIVCFLAWLLPDRWLDALMGLILNRKPLRS